MQKDFDVWNLVKKKIHNERKVKYVRKCQVWWGVLGINIGSEQDGKGLQFERPLIVMRVINLQTAIVVPLTSNMSRVDTGYLLSSLRNSVALPQQIRLISTKRLIRLMHKIQVEEYEDLKLRIKNLFI